MPNGAMLGLYIAILLVAAYAAAFSNPRVQAADDSVAVAAKIKVEVVASHLNIPWSIAFAPDGRIFFTERTGSVRVIETNGTLLIEPAANINVARAGEGGLLGIALDPEFENNHYLYVFYTYSDFFGLHNKVSRFSESDNKITDEHVLLDNIPAADIHDGGRIIFGPDGKLYVTTGVAANPESSQDTKSLAGKILRINKDGTIPGDNPFQGSPVYSYGHRNPQGLAWDPVTSKLVETEHGPSGEMGFYAHDEINVIEPGKNYGWPKVIGIANSAYYVDPIFQTGDITWAPSGATFYTDNKIPEWKGKFLVATLRGSQLKVIQFDANNITKVISIDSAFQGTYGRLRDIEQGPDGYLYLLTSNQDGRGVPAADDDKILRIVGESSAAVPEFSSGSVALLLSVLLLLATKLAWKKQPL